MPGILSSESLLTLVPGLFPMVVVKPKLALLRSEHPPWLTLLHRVMDRKKPGKKTGLSS